MNTDNMPKRLDRKTIYESDYVCLYADRVEMPDISLRTIIKYIILRTQSVL